MVRVVSFMVLMLVLLCCGEASAGPASNFEESFDAPLDTATKWENVSGVMASAGKLVLQSTPEHHTGGAEILDMPTGDSDKKLVVTLEGVDLTAGAHHLRSVTVRVRSPANVVYATITAYKDARGGNDKVAYVLGIAGSATNVLRGEIDGAPLQGDLILDVDNSSAELTFDGKGPTDALAVTGDDIDFCRIELMADTSLGGNPSIDRVEATR